MIGLARVIVPILDQYESHAHIIAFFSLLVPESVPKSVWIVGMTLYDSSDGASCEG